MLKKYLILLVSILGGVGGFFLRSWQISTSFELSTGLPIPGTSASIAISLFSALIVLSLIGLGISLRRTAPQELTAQSSAPSFLILLSTCAAAALTAVSAYLFLQDALLLRQLERRTDLLLFCFAILGFLSAVALFRIGMLRYKAKPLGSSPALLLPAYSGCLWLMISYQTLAGDPFVTDYIFVLFAIMSGMLAHYFIASHGFQNPRREVICILAGLTVYFSFVSFTPSAITAHSYLLLAQILYFIPTLLLLLRNDPSMQPTAGMDSDSNSDYDEQPSKEETP